MRYTGVKTKEISFPLGGIGAGSVGLGGDGRLVDWEIANRPNKGSVNGCSHFAVRARKGGKVVDARVLNGDLQKNFTGQYGEKGHRGYGNGPFTESMAGFPHFRDVTFDGEFPLAILSFADEHFPGRVTLTAFNPFIPSNGDDSSMPAAFFAFEIENTGGEAFEYTLAFSLGNPFPQGAVNRAWTGEGRTGLLLSREPADENDPAWGQLCAATDGPNAGAQAYWYRGDWFDSLAGYWRAFAGGGGLPPRAYDSPGKYDMATLWADTALAPGEKATLRFVLSWYYPTNHNSWNPWEGRDNTWKNWYATRFSGAREAADYALDHWARLYGGTLAFHDALFASTLPPEVLDAAASNLSVLHSPAVWRLADGTFYGWEGAQEKIGSCEGSCTHVWNYAYALPFLFPALERSMRDADYRYNLWPSGRMSFRLQLPLGRPYNTFHPCVDGQMGGVIKSYRDWKLSGDDAWLHRVWPSVQKSLEFAWLPENEDRWDADGDGVMEGRQHHTLDMELFGPSAWLQGFYLAALKAGAEMADFVGDTDAAARYRRLFENGSRHLESELFNGSWYVQRTDLRNRVVLESFNAQNTYWHEEAGQIKYQIGQGSAIDQMCVQWHAVIAGLGDIFDPAQRKIALHSMYWHNFIPCMREVYNPCRLFCLNDEGAAVICAYPEGTEKPAVPVPYAEECFTGCEYQLAGLFFAEGMYGEGLTLVRAVRERYDGEKRNPYNEIECGSNYARSMASYALIPILSGFSFDLSRGHLGFAPRLNLPEFVCFWSVDGAWGTVRVTGGRCELRVLYGAVSLSSFACAGLEQPEKLILDGRDTNFTVKNGAVCFSRASVRESLTLEA